MFCFSIAIVVVSCCCCAISYCYCCCGLFLLVLIGFECGFLVESVMVWVWAWCVFGVGEYVCVGVSGLLGVGCRGVRVGHRGSGVLGELWDLGVEHLGCWLGLGIFGFGLQTGM